MSFLNNVCTHEQSIRLVLETPNRPSPQSRDAGIARRLIILRVVTQFFSPQTYCTRERTLSPPRGLIYSTRITSIDIPNRSSCGRTRSASPTTTQVKLSGLIYCRAVRSSVAASNPR
jgi:hypothetical protein